MRSANNFLVSKTTSHVTSESKKSCNIWFYIFNYPSCGYSRLNFILRLKKNLGSRGFCLSGVHVGGLSCSACSAVNFGPCTHNWKEVNYLLDDLRANTT